MTNQEQKIIELEVEIDVLKIQLERQTNINKKQAKQLDLHGVSVSLPTKDEITTRGYRVARYEGFKYKKVLADSNADAYYTGWCDCAELITKGNER